MHRRRPSSGRTVVGSLEHRRSGQHLILEAIEALEVRRRHDDMVSVTSPEGGNTRRKLNAEALH